MPASKRKQPYESFRFKIAIDNLISGGFSECSGLQVETEVEDFREGGCNEYAHKLPKATKYGSIVLKRGYMDTDNIHTWQSSIREGRPFERKNMSVILLDSQGNTVRQWDFKEAFPVKWNTSEFKADSSALLVETFEFVHHGLIMVI